MANPELTASNGTEVALVRLKRKLSSAELRQRRLANVSNGLQARTQVGSRYRERRVGHYLRKVLSVAAEANRTVDALQLPSVRRWCRLDILNQEAYEEIAGELKEGRRLSDVSSKVMEIFIATANGARNEEAALGWSASARGSLLRDLAGAARDRQAAQAQAELAARYGPNRTAREVRPT